MYSLYQDYLYMSHGLKFKSMSANSDISVNMKSERNVNILVLKKDILL